MTPLTREKSQQMLTAMCTLGWVPGPGEGAEGPAVAWTFHLQRAAVNTNDSSDLGDTETIEADKGPGGEQNQEAVERKSSNF